MKIKTVLPSLAFISVLLSGCFGGNPPMQFYMLNAGNVATAATRSLPDARKTVIGVGPVRIPEYLDRPQMVIGVTENQYRLDDQHRWAEHLDDNISRVLLQSLSLQLDGVQVVSFPWSTLQSPILQVKLEILDLMRDASGQSRLSAQWTLKDENKTLSSKHFDCSFPVPKDDYEAFVRTQSECLNRLSTEMAVTIRQYLAAGGGK
ncbi:MAG: PqiC family protein [Gammaproteobacteria bacterium]